MTKYEYLMEMARRSGIDTTQFWSELVARNYAASVLSLWIVAVLFAAGTLALVAGLVVYLRSTDSDAGSAWFVAVVVWILLVGVCAAIATDAYSGYIAPMADTFSDLLLTVW